MPGYRGSRDVATVQRGASLSTEFGLDYALKLFGQEAIDSLPVITRGPNKGKPRGYVVWKKTTAAGYHTNAGTGVAANTVVRAWIAESELADESMSVPGLWMGRIQNLCGSKALLNEGARQHETALRQAERDERDREFVEYLDTITDPEAREASRAKRAAFTERMESDLAKRLAEIKVRKR